MSGEEKLEEQSNLKFDDQLAKIDAILADYKANLKLDQIPDYDESVDEWFNVSQITLSAMDEEMCLQAAEMVLTYHTYLVRKLTEERVRLRVVNNIITTWASKHWSKYSKSFMSNEMRLSAISQNDCLALQEPLKLKNWIELRIASIEDLAGCAKDRYHFYLSYARCK